VASGASEAPEKKVARGKLTVSPKSLSFGRVQAGTSRQMLVSLTNASASNVAIDVTKITATGAGFLVSPFGCLGNLVGRCEVVVTFAPATANGAKGTKVIGRLTIKDNASNSPQTVGLSGTKFGPLVTPAKVADLGGGVDNLCADNFNALANPRNAGDFITIIITAAALPGGTAPTIDTGGIYDSQGNTFALLDSFSLTWANHYYLKIQSALLGATNITIPFMGGAGTCTVGYDVSEWSGMPPAAVVDQTTTANGSLPYPTPPATPSVTTGTTRRTSQKVELVLGAVSAIQPATIESGGPSGSFQTLGSESGLAEIGLAAYTITSSVGTLGTAWTTSGPASYSGSMITLWGGPTATATRSPALHGTPTATAATAAPCVSGMCGQVVGELLPIANPSVTLYTVGSYGSGATSLSTVAAGADGGFNVSLAHLSGGQPAGRNRSRGFFAQQPRARMTIVKAPCTTKSK